ncbi:MAG: SAP domain-containing protein [Planctomycetes bacterium]|nr:SAP domain-containing protein [Planctomycetota bacterium]
MRPRREPKATRKPRLELGLRVADFVAYYWFKAELVEFARRLGLPVDGSKPELSARIERRLRGLPDRRRATAKVPPGPRDSAKKLRRDTSVVRYLSDAKTRAFFIAEIGPEFHFTYHVNQFRLHHDGLTYGDLVDEWLRERARRRRDDYEAPIAEQGKYNRFIRAFFADTKNRGKSLADAARAWNAVKHRRGTPRYRRR